MGCAISFNKISDKRSFRGSVPLTVSFVTVQHCRNKEAAINITPRNMSKQGRGIKEVVRAPRIAPGMVAAAKRMTGPIVHTFHPHISQRS